MFERFTDRARRVVVLAQEEARMLNHNYIGTEHILLGLIHEGEGVAAKGLESLGISLEGVRAQVEEIIGQGQQAPSGSSATTTSVQSTSFSDLSVKVKALPHKYSLS
jgi:ATP-dependent Clp protease ATP-binding subunit ClpC